MQSRDKLHSDHEASLFSSIDKKKSACLYSLPAAYFDQFPEQILNRIRLATTEAPNELPQDKTLPLLIPEDYFERFTAGLLQRVRQMAGDSDSNVLSLLAGNNPYEVPAGYFEQFPVQLLHALATPASPADPQQEIQDLSPLLADLKDKKPYKVPEGYFQKPRKTIAFHHAASRSIRWARWTAAASILLIFSLGAFQFFNTPSRPSIADQSIREALAEIPDAAIQRYLEQSINDFELNSLTQSFAVNEASTTPDDILKGVTDQEIRAYLEGSNNY